MSRKCRGAHKGVEASIGGGSSPLKSLAVYGGRFWLAWLASFLFFVGFYALLLPLPLRLQQLELPPWQIAIVLGAFGVGTLIARPLVGVLADTQGRRRVLVASALVSAAATAGTAAATDALALLGLRLVHAAAYAGFTTAAVALASDLSGRARRTGALAIFAMSTSLALSLTPQLMAPAVFLFGTAGALSFAALAVAMSAVPAAYAAPSHSVASAAPRSSTELASGLRTLWQPFARACGLGLGFGVYLLFLPLLVEQEGYGNGAMLYAAFGVAMILTRLLISDPLNGRWREALVVTAWTAAAAGLFAFTLIPSLLGGLIASALVAFGFGVLHPAIVATHVDALPDHRHGVAVAVFYLGFDGGIGFGSWVLTPLFALLGVSSMFAAAGAISFLFGCWSLFGLRRRDQIRTSPSY